MRIVENWSGIALRFCTRRRRLLWGKRFGRSQLGTLGKWGGRCSHSECIRLDGTECLNRGRTLPVKIEQGNRFVPGDLPGRFGPRLQRVLELAIVKHSARWGGDENGLRSRLPYFLYVPAQVSREFCF